MIEYLGIKRKKFLLLAVALVLLGFPAIAFAQTVPGFTVTTFATGIPRTRDVSTDSAGNVYTMERDQGGVFKISPTGEVSTVANLPGEFSAYVGPHFEPVSGNLYVSNFANFSGTTVLEITPYGVVSVFASGIPDPAGITSDAAGNVYVSSHTAAGQVFKITPGGVVSVFATGLNLPDPLAFNSGGDLFIGNRGTDQIMKVPAGGGTASVFASGFNNPTGLDIDSQGNIYVANTDDGTISKVTPAGVVSPFGIGFSSPNGLAFDPSENLFVANFGSGVIHKVASSNPVFRDDFDGSSIDSNLWNTSIATSGARWCTPELVTRLQFTSPGEWTDPSSQPCLGMTVTPPFGTINLSGGQVSLSAGAIGAFPYFWTGPPSRPSPFPTSGGFTLTVRMKYDDITAHGDGLQVLYWEDSSPAGNNPPIPSGQGVFGIWSSGVGLLGDTAPVLNPTEFHEYSLRYSGGEYTLNIDGALALGPTVSNIRPNTIWIGNPIITQWGLHDWTDFTLDYVSVVEEPPPVPIVTGFQWPFTDQRDPEVNEYYEITKGFYSKSIVGCDPHFAVDFLKYLGPVPGMPDPYQQVYSVADGLVVLVEKNYPGYGDYVVIKHNLGAGNEIYSLYAHLKKDSALVQKWQIVTRGQPIGTQGNTGAPADMPFKIHLHFELRHNRPQPPYCVEINFTDPYIFISDEKWWWEGHTSLESRASMLTFTIGDELETYQNSGTINPNQETPVFKVLLTEIEKFLTFVLHFPGSTLELTIYRPDGSIYGVYETDDPPLLVLIPDPELGEWGYSIEGVDVPHPDYPYVVSVGVRHNPFASIEISGSPPTADAGGPYVVNEGEALLLDASGSTGTDANITLYEWDLDYDGEFDDAVGMTTPVSFNDNGSYTVGLRVTDETGEIDTDTAEVTVYNVAPIVDTGPDHEVISGDVASKEISFSDAGTADAPWEFAIDWGDGAIDAGETSDQSVPIVAGHQYFLPGEYTVEVCVNDKDFDTGCDNQIVRVRRLPVEIDIKPKDSVNEIKMSKKGELKGKVKVAILSTADFDAPAEVDWNTLTFGHTGDEDSLATDRKHLKPRCKAKDVNKDHIKDLVCDYTLEMTDFLKDDIEGILRGTLIDGRQIEGRDSVVIIDRQKDKEESKP